MGSGLILFIHGLGGDPIKTWGHFPELIRKDKDIENYDVDFFGYPTSLFRLPFSKKYPRIQMLAKALRTQLERKFPDKKNVILVCHSLGGLIARKYLVDEVMQKKQLRVTRLLLYAVPNNGAGLASVAHHISWRHSQLSQLCKRSDLIGDLNEDWFNLNISQKVRLRYVVAGLDRVVDEESAQAFWGNPDIDVIADRGHIDVVKPYDNKDLSFIILKSFLAQCDTALRSSSITEYATRSAGKLKGPTSSRSLRKKGYKIIGFDFDGTLLRGLEFSWTHVWEFLDYPKSVRKEGMRRYVSGETTYEAWCEWACKLFRKRKLKREDFAKIVAPLHVTKNLKEALDILQNDGFVLAIISGGIDVFIDEKIPNAKDLFDYIFINRLIFDDTGIISGIQPTDFDFEGKARALELLCKEYDVSLKEAVFVGEGFNDGPVTKKAGLSIAYPPSAQEVRSAAHIEIKEDDLLKILEYVM